ncbi:asparaginase [Dactylosporangium matsuzakiense]|uniref:Asparaginase n=1 Tax=Dactylosporangium matsuzakiense TaxID=53360 RepID=A0A9W6KHQ7_9ACTN|nr:asparaginase [Dactylosporangium matsuzakiense]UWZ45531.1 asparaginase [Dactylosporangium matsuzakiense]GLL00471.1 asparaginase [Dactylosporangium matsuzakiense]
MTDLYAGGELLAEVVRNDVVESRHHGSVVVLGADGEVAAWAGDVLGPVFPRSAVKPLQAVGMLRAGLAADGQELALVAASHRGQGVHLAGVRDMLHRSGLTVQDLRCPPDYPLAEDARDAVVRAGHGRERVFMNCSGKHAGMLRTAQVNGWPLETYLEADHPLQRHLADTMAELAGEPIAAVAVDGCGAPTPAFSLRGLASSFLRLVSAAPGSQERAVADAMREHPLLVSGEDPTEDDTRLMRAVPGLLLKGGAEGVAAAALPGVGAVALKIDDGGMRARFPVLAAGFGRLGVNLPGQVAVLGGGRPVGVVRSVW